MLLIDLLSAVTFAMLLYSQKFVVQHESTFYLVSLTAAHLLCMAGVLLVCRVRNKEWLPTYDSTNFFWISQGTLNRSSYLDEVLFFSFIVGGGLGYYLFNTGKANPAIDIPVERGCLLALAISTPFSAYLNWSWLRFILWVPAAIWIAFIVLHQLWTYVVSS